MSVLVCFDGRSLSIFDRDIPASCIVRNHENGQRRADQIVRTMGSTTPHGIAYQPMRFPMGMHKVTRAIAMPDDSVYWPMYVATDAEQMLEVWDTKDGQYLGPSGSMINGKGYGIHHARWHKPGVGLVPSRTTLGCINILDPADALWFGRKVKALLREGADVKLWVPSWETWRDDG